LLSTLLIYKNILNVRKGSDIYVHMKKPRIFKQLKIKIFVNLLKKSVKPTKIFKCKTNTVICVYLSNA